MHPIRGFTRRRNGARIRTITRHSLPLPAWMKVRVPPRTFGIGNRASRRQTDKKAWAPDPSKSTLSNRHSPRLLSHNIPNGPLSGVPQEPLGRNRPPAFTLCYKVSGPSPLPPRFEPVDQMERDGND